MQTNHSASNRSRKKNGGGVSFTARIKKFSADDLPGMKAKNSASGFMVQFTGPIVI
jgi:hypothetical protein